MRAAFVLLLLSSVLGCPEEVGPRPADDAADLQLPADTPELDVPRPLQPDVPSPDAKTEDTEPAAAQPADTGPADTGPADTQPADAQPADAQPSDAELADTGADDVGVPLCGLPTGQGCAAPSACGALGCTGAKGLLTVTTAGPYCGQGPLQASVSPDVGAPDDVVVSAWIRVGGAWWPKPTFEQLTIVPQSDYSVTVNVVTAPTDKAFDRLALYLLPAGTEVPAEGGAPEPPSALEAAALDEVRVERAPGVRTLEFSGLLWDVRSGLCDTPQGPGPNLWTDEEAAVWLDDNGHLHLRLAPDDDGVWRALELVTVTGGYGTYRFSIASGAEALPPEVVLGLFTYDHSAGPPFREIDVEVAQFGNPDQLYQYVVQPYEPAGNLKSQPGPLPAAHTHEFTWSSEAVHFQTTTAAGDTVAAWTYTGPDIPLGGPVPARINLWMIGGGAPVQPVEVVLSQFEYLPGPM